MKSGKQRKAEIKVNRARQEAMQPTLQGGQGQKEIPTGAAPCNSASLAPSRSTVVPDFVERGFYMDALFRCGSCFRQEIWSAAQQKWWYEVAKGPLESSAKLCGSCRKVERARKAEASVFT